MTEGTNMICPGCGAFQPRAEVCKQCGIIIAKAASTASSTMQRPAPAVTGKPPVALIATVVVLAAVVIGYFLFSGSGAEDKNENVTATAREPAGRKSEAERIAAYNPAVASNLQRTSVLGKLSQVRAALNLYTVDGNEPPVNGVGLRALVDEGLLSQADITDDWGNIFVYRLEWGKETAFEKEYKIYLSSSGPDGIPGNADDIGI